MRTRLSICRRKARFRSEREALGTVRGSDTLLSAYRCDRCWQFHLTSRTKGKWRPRRATSETEPNRIATPNAPD